MQQKSLLLTERLENTNQLHQWATKERTRKFLWRELKIERIPILYCWFLCLLKSIKPELLNQCLMKWAEGMLPEDRRGISVALDRNIPSTGKMGSYNSPLHIVSARLRELGITLSSESVKGKSNEIPAVQELLKELNVNGCMIVVDALNCQKRR